MHTQIVIYSAGDTPIERLLVDIPEFELQELHTLSPEYPNIYKTIVRGKISGVSRMVFVQTEGIEEHLPIPKTISHPPFGFYDSMFHYLHQVELDANITIEHYQPHIGKFIQVPVQQTILETRETPHVHQVQCA